MSPSQIPDAPVLVIDDDPVLRDVLCLMLGASGYTPVGVAGEADAVAAIASAVPRAVPRAVLCDLQLGDTSGGALLAKLRAMLPADTTLIAISGAQASADEVTAADAFLLKPFTAAALLAALSAGSRASVGPASVAAPTPFAVTHAPALDDAVVERLASSMPAPALPQLYALALSDAGTRVERIRVAQQAGDLDTMRREAHALRGGAGMVGAAELHHLAGAFEQARTALDTPAIVELLAALARLRDMLAARFPATI